LKLGNLSEKELYHPNGEKKEARGRSRHLGWDLWLS
jgi:hypothetical protein